MSLDRPQARIPIASVTINGTRYECVITQPWYRLHQSIYDNLGGSSGLDVQSIDGGSYAAMQPFVQDQSYSDLSQPYCSAPTYTIEAMQGLDVAMPLVDIVQGFDVQQQSTDILQADCMQMQDLQIYQG